VIAVNGTSLAKGIKSLKAIRKKVADTADGAYRQKLYYLFEKGARVSPQWSGDFTSNWNIVVDGNMPIYKPWPGKFESRLSRHDDAHTGAAAYRVTPHQAGDPEAVGTALARGAAQLRGVTMKSRVHFVNATELHVGDGGTTMVGLDGVERLRPENVIPTGTRIEAYIKTMAAAVPQNLNNPEVP
jgi:hypothetical protein